MRPPPAQPLKQPLCLLCPCLLLEQPTTPSVRCTDAVKRTLSVGCTDAAAAAVVPLHKHRNIFGDEGVKIEFYRWAGGQGGGGAEGVVISKLSTVAVCTSCH